MSKIPEGTQYIEVGCGEKGFRKYEKECWWFFEGFWRRVDWQMGDLKPLTEHPFYAASVADWSGEGLPPVGMVCECRLPGELTNNYSWAEAKVIWHNGPTECAVIRSSSKLAWCDEFRPIRTAEQIAADEHLHKVRNALTAIGQGIEKWNTSTDCSAAMRATVEAMIDAGYRKEPTQ